MSGKYNLFLPLWKKKNDLQSAFQLFYTTLFGMHVSYLFLRTGSILPPITAHIWCNIMGIPEIVWELRVFPKHRKGMLFLSFG